MDTNIKNIIIKSILFEINSDEQILLTCWLNENRYNKSCYKKIKQLNNEASIISFIESIDTMNALNKIKNRINKDNTKKRATILAWSTSVAVAIITISLLVINYTTEEITPIIASSTLNQDSISSKALLTLSTGETISLGTDNEINKTVGESEINITDDKIVIKKQINTITKEKQVLSMNILTVPHGESFNITLPDGTKVWVNAMSKFKFPNEFIGGKRVVELDGEAYFEVTEDKNNPFIVKMKNYDVKVLGTSFNISNYEGENISKTTLCSGKVDIKLNQQNSKHITLVPGNQISINQLDNSTVIKDVNTDNFIAWRNGFYYFENQSLEELFKTLEKLYEIDDITFDDEKLAKKLYSGKFNKEDNFNKILKIIETGTDCLIIRDGRKLTMKNKK